MSWPSGELAGDAGVPWGFWSKFSGFHMEVIWLCLETIISVVSLCALLLGLGGTDQDCV